MKRRFLVAKESEVLRGRTTDVFFTRTARILKRRGLEWTQVVAEFTTSCTYGREVCTVFAGLDEVLDLLTDKQVDVYAIPEGTVIPAVNALGNRVPVLDIRGPYGEFCEFETPALGLISQASGVATRAARVRWAADGREVLSLGVRRMHPAIAPMLDYYAYLGGCDSISTKLGAEVTGTIPTGTMPRAFYVVVGDSRTALEMFHADLEDEIPRIALVDTFTDNKHEALLAAEFIGPHLQGIRLNRDDGDHGDLVELVKQVREDLDDKGFKNVKIYVSGGLDEDIIPSLVRAGAEGFGVGTAISNAPVVKYMMDIVEVEGIAHKVHGQTLGAREVFRCQRCLSTRVVRREALKGKKAQAPFCRSCGEEMGLLTRQVMDNGKRTREPESVEEKRSRVLNEIRLFHGD